MPGSGPTTLSLPPFTGATRRLILICVAVFFIDAILVHVLPDRLYVLLLTHLLLRPDHLIFGQIWQPLTYIFLPLGILGEVLAMVTLWMIGSLLESVRGSRWLYELFFTSAIGGAVLASAISFTNIFGLSPASIGIGPGPGILGLLLALAVLMGDTEFFMFLFTIRAKYLVAIYILIDIATLLKTDNPFGALLHLSGALCGYLFLKFVPRRGLLFGATERYYALRNNFYRSKRRRAARKFEVYMNKQGRQVHFDKEGRYVDPDKDPTDKRWMN